jgi:hypothetical protein
MQLVTVPPPNIPPPMKRASFPLNVQLVTVGLPPPLAIPLPEFPQNVQLTTVVLLWKLSIPPP